MPGLTRQVTMALISVLLLTTFMMASALLWRFNAEHSVARDTAIQKSQAHLQQQFLTFDRLIAEDENRLDTRVKTMLPLLSEELLAHPDFPHDISKGTLDTISAHYGVDEIFILNRAGVVINTNYLPDMNLDLAGVSSEMAALLEGLYGAGTVFSDRFNVSVNSGDIKKYSYYGPTGSDYIIETAHHLKPYLERLRSQGYVDFLFAEMFNVAETDTGIAATDIYIPHDIGVWSLLNPGAPVPQHIIEDIDAINGTGTLQKSDYQIHIYNLFERVDATAGQTPHVITHIVYDYSAHMHTMIRGYVILAALLVAILTLSFYAISQRLDQTVLQHIRKLLEHLRLPIPPNPPVLHFADGAAPELTQISAAINKMQQRIKDTEAELDNLNISFEDAIAARTSTLREVNEKLHELSTQDPLTGLANRRVFDTHLALELERAARSDSPLTVMLMDMDYFQQFNDRMGLHAGDKCLEAVGELLGWRIRGPNNMVARFSGEKFGLVLANTDLAAANAQARILLAHIEDLKIRHLSSPISKYVTASIGVITVYNVADRTPAELIGFAEKMLFDAKQKGRNQFTGRAITGS